MARDWQGRQLVAILLLFSPKAHHSPKIRQIALPIVTEGASPHDPTYD